MLTRLATDKVDRREAVCLSRADTVHGWATQGARTWASVQGESLHISPRPDFVLYRKSWFGGNRNCAGYTPKSVQKLLAEQENTVFRHGLVAGAIQHYAERFKYIMVKRACQILRDIGSGDDVFYQIASDDSEHGQTSNMLIDQCEGVPPQKKWWLARRVFPIKFIGGPPNKWSVYRGSLRTLMLDRIAVVILLEGMAGLDKVFKPTERYSAVA